MARFSPDGAGSAFFVALWEPTEFLDRRENPRVVWRGGLHGFGRDTVFDEDGYLKAAGMLGRDDSVAELKQRDPVVYRMQ